MKIAFWLFLLISQTFANDVIDLGNLEIEGESRMPQIEFIRGQNDFDRITGDFIRRDLESLGESPYFFQIETFNELKNNKSNARKSLEDFEAEIMN